LQLDARGRQSWLDQADFRDVAGGVVDHVDLDEHDNYHHTCPGAGRRGRDIGGSSASGCTGARCQRSSVYLAVE
jgi:hypothetical protein